MPEPEATPPKVNTRASTWCVPGWPFVSPDGRWVVVTTFDAQADRGYAEILDAKNLRDRRAVATGRYESDGEILLRGRSHEGRPGVHLVTPLRTAGDGALVLVNRGFVPETADVDAVVFLVGDAGLAIEGRSPMLEKLKSDVEAWSAALARDSAVSIIFLGDNVYPDGVHERGHPSFAQDSIHLWSQIHLLSGEAALEHNTVGLFLTGNHDWGNMVGRRALERVHNLEAELVRAREQGPRVALLPPAGHPGPIVRDLRQTGERRHFTFGSRDEFVGWWRTALVAGHLVYLEARTGDAADEPVAGLILYRHGGRLSTVHSADPAASRAAHPGALHLLRWRAIQLAIRLLVTHKSRLLDLDDGDQET